jgi:hypothetical protein
LQDDQWINQCRRLIGVAVKNGAAGGVSLPRFVGDKVQIAIRGKAERATGSIAKLAHLRGPTH